MNLTWGVISSWCSEGITGRRLLSSQHGNQARETGAETMGELAGVSLHSLFFALESPDPVRSLDFYCVPIRSLPRLLGLMTT